MELDGIMDSTAIIVIVGIIALALLFLPVISDKHGDKVSIIVAIILAITGN